jgi:hypothetical protein
MHLHRVELRYRARLAAEEVAVVRVERDRGSEFDRPAPEGFGKADLGFQRPAIGADVYELVAVVLARAGR